MQHRREQIISLMLINMRVVLMVLQLLEYLLFAFMEESTSMQNRVVTELRSSVKSHRY